MDSRRRLSTEPGEKRTKFLNLDDIKLLVRSAVLDEREEDCTIGRGVHGDEVGGISHASNSKAGPKRSKSSGSRNSLAEKDGKDMLESIDI